MTDYFKFYFNVHYSSFKAQFKSVHSVKPCLTALPSQCFSLLTQHLLYNHELLGEMAYLDCFFSYLLPIITLFYICVLFRFNGDSQIGMVCMCVGGDELGRQVAAYQAYQIKRVTCTLEKHGTSSHLP